jgi:phage gpG-like protein
MTPEQFQQRIKTLETQFKEFFDKAGPIIAGNVAKSKFKENFQKESFFGEKWKEVKRREPVWRVKRKNKSGTYYKEIPNPTKGAARSRKILTGKTGDLGRSIEVKEAANGRAVIWSDPAVLSSKAPYGRVHNEGLKAGRGNGFTMPKRQFMGDHPELRKAVAEAIERKLNEIFKK